MYIVTTFHCLKHEVADNLTADEISSFFWQLQIWPYNNLNCKPGILAWWLVSNQFFHRHGSTNKGILLASGREKGGRLLPDRFKIKLLYEMFTYNSKVM